MGEMEQLLATGGTTWRGGEKPAGSGERWPGELEGQVVV
jgi:hypothetical protein